MMLINQTAVRKVAHESHKHVSADTLAALDGIVQTIVRRAIQNSNGFRRIRPLEIRFAAGEVPTALSRRTR